MINSYRTGKVRTIIINIKTDADANPRYKSKKIYV